MLSSKRSAPNFAQGRSGTSTGINGSFGFALECSAHTPQAATVSYICDDTLTRIRLLLPWFLHFTYPGEYDESFPASPTEVSWALRAHFPRMANRLNRSLSVYDRCSIPNRPPPGNVPRETFPRLDHFPRTANRLDRSVRLCRTSTILEMEVHFSAVGPSLEDHATQFCHFHVFCSVFFFLLFFFVLLHQWTFEHAFGVLSKGFR